MQVVELSLTDDVLKAKTLWEIIPVGHRIGIRAHLFKELVNLFLVPVVFLFLLALDRLVWQHLIG